MLTQRERLTRPILVEVIVGSEEDTLTWHLSQDLLTHVSPFFKAALTGNFAEAGSKIVKLPEDNVHAFELFVRWLDDGEIAAPSWVTSQIYVQAWILGDKLGCQIFQELALLGLIHGHSYWGIAETTLKAVYDGTPAGSKIRQWAIDQLRHNALTQTQTEDLKKFLISYVRDSPDFASDVMKAYFDTRQRGYVPRNPYVCGQDYLEFVPYTN